MMSEELKIKVSLDTSGINDGIKQIKNSLKDANTGFGGIDKATQSTTASTKAATAAMVAMGATTVAQTAVVAKQITDMK